MDIKKSKRANIESRRTLFFQVGLSIVLISVLAAFEWATPVSNEAKIANDNAKHSVAEVIIPITNHTKPEPIEPKRPVVEFEKVNDPEEEFDDGEFILPDINDTGNPYPYYEFKKDKEKPEVVDFYSVQKKPTFRGGELSAFGQYVGSKIVFPEEAIRMGLSGTIKITFVINEEGEVADARITRSVDPMLDEIVLNIIKNSKGWKPGIQNGQKVKVQLTMPITFDIK